MINLYLDDELFGPLLPYVEDDDITDINWNGEDLWIDSLKKGRYKEECKISNHFVDQFSMKVSNLVNRSFNQYEPVLEAETDTLRISIIHSAVTNTGTSLSIRKTLPVRRINREKMLQEKYCVEEIDNFMQNAIHAHCNVFICGETGVGKTEYLKVLTEYIPAYEKVITIEDNYEIKYRKINPGKDCVEIKAGDTTYLSYSNAIKACLRQFPKWILLSEARGLEVKDLINSLSSGAYCITTGHANDARNIPSRILNMMGENATISLNDVYSFIDIGVLIRNEIHPDKGSARWIDQIVLFSNENGVNTQTVIYENKKFISKEIPSSLMKKFENIGIKDPFSL